MDLDIRQREFRQLREAREIQHILEPLERVGLARRCRIQRLRQHQGLRAHVHRRHIDLAPHARAFDQSAHGHVRRIGDIAQHRRLRGVVTRAARHLDRVPGGTRNHVQLTVPHNPSDFPDVLAHGLGHVDGCCDLDPAPAQIETLVIGKGHQRLKASAKRLDLVAKGGGIGRQVKVPAQDQPLVRRQRDLPDKARRIFERHRVAQQIEALRHQNLAPVRG